MIELLFLVVKFILIGIVLLGFFQALVTHVILLCELRLEYLRDQETNDLISWDILLKSFLIESACNIAHLLLLPFANLQYTPESKVKNSPPILLVHGFMHNQTDWLWFRQQLQHNSEIGPIYSLNLLSSFNSIATLAETLQHKIKEIQDETGHKSIILIGHSMGGLVASYYSEYLAEKGEITKLISLGAPYQGTRLSAFGTGKSIQEMSPNSDFLSKLLQRIQDSSIPYYYVASKIDNLVVPWKSAIPPHIKDNDDNIMILDDHGHIRLLVSPRVIDQVTEWLQ